MKRDGQSDVSCQACVAVTQQTTHPVQVEHRKEAISQVRSIRGRNGVQVAVKVVTARVLCFMVGAGLIVHLPRFRRGLNGQAILASDETRWADEQGQW